MLGYDQPTRLRALKALVELKLLEVSWKSIPRANREIEGKTQRLAYDALRPLFLTAKRTTSKDVAGRVRFYERDLRLVGRQQAVVAAQYGKNRIIRDVQMLPGPESKIAHSPITADQRIQSQARADEATRRAMGRLQPDIEKAQGIADTTERHARLDSLLAQISRQFARRIAHDSRSDVEFETTMDHAKKIEWVDSDDDRVRRSHIEVDGTQVTPGEYFGNECRYPRDPEGPAHETEGCRCRLKVVS